MGQKTIVGDLNVTGAIKQNGTDIAPTIVEICGSLSELETTIEITQAQYQTLLGNNVVLKINDAENGSLYLYKTNAVTEPNMAIYSNILTNVSFSATVSQVETEGEPEYAVIISTQTLGGTKLYYHYLFTTNEGYGIHLFTNKEQLSYDMNVSDIINALFGRGGVETSARFLSDVAKVPPSSILLQFTSLDGTTKSVNILSSEFTDTVTEL